MTAKEYLLQIKALDSAISRARAELDELREKATCIRSTSDIDGEKVIGSGFADNARFTALVHKIADAQAKYNRRVDEWIDLRARIIEQIAGLEDERHKALLYKRYVDMETFKIIAAEMQYSYIYCCELHGQALKAFEHEYLSKNIANLKSP